MQAFSWRVIDQDLIKGHQSFLEISMLDAEGLEYGSANREIKNMKTNLPKKTNFFKNKVTDLQTIHRVKLC